MLPKQILVSQQLANPRVLGVKLNVYAPNARTVFKDNCLTSEKTDKTTKTKSQLVACKSYTWIVKVSQNLIIKNLSASKLICKYWMSICKCHFNAQRAPFDLLLVYIICAKSKRLQHHDYGEYKLEYIGKTARPLHTIWPPLLTFNHYKWLLQQII